MRKNTAFSIGTQVLEGRIGLSTVNILLIFFPPKLTISLEFLCFEHLRLFSVAGEILFLVGGQVREFRIPRKLGWMLLVCVLAIEPGLCLASPHLPERLDKLSVTFHTHHRQNINVNNLLTLVINIAKSSIHKSGCLGNLLFCSLVHYVDAICNYTMTCYYFLRTLDLYGARISQGSFNEYR